MDTQQKLLKQQWIEPVLLRNTQRLLTRKPIDAATPLYG